MTRLVLTRHGQSQWNLENRFTGWVDVDLTTQGEEEARQTGHLLAEASFAPDLAYTSLLKRAIRTLWLALEGIDRTWIPVEKDWRLNERHYGNLTGRNKREVSTEYGAEQVRVWRRSFDTLPPALDETNPYNPVHDPRYAQFDQDALPATESLAQTLARVEPYFRLVISPKLEQGADVIISAHGNSLRALLMVLFQLSAEDIMNYELPTGNPLLIELDGLTPRSARFLNLERASLIPPIR